MLPKKEDWLSQSPAHRSKGEWVRLAESLEGALSYHGHGLHTTEGRLEGQAVVVSWNVMGGLEDFI